jgi:hypothetical protein
MICDMASGRDGAAFRGELSRLKVKLAPYSFTRSPLRYLESGLANANPDIAGRVVEVFTLLRESDVTAVDAPFGTPAVATPAGAG